MILDYVQDILTSQDLSKTIIIGILGGLILKFFSSLYTYVVNCIYKKSNFTLSGIWVSSFNSYIPDKKNIELVVIKQKKESINLYIEQYSNHKQKVKKYRGTGVFRGSELSSVYYPLDKNDIQNGALVLKLFHSPIEGPYLNGIYTEVSYNGEDQTAKVENGEYRLERLNIPITKKFLVHLKKTYFRNYTEFQLYLLEHTS